MGQVKKALMEAECNGHVHPLFAQMLCAFQPQSSQPATHTISSASETNPYEPTTIYGLYVNGMLATTYLHKDTAEYECWVSRMGEEVRHAETCNTYDVRPLPMHTHRPD